MIATSTIVGTLVSSYYAVGQQRRGHQLQHRVLGPGNDHLAASGPARRTTIRFWDQRFRDRRLRWRDGGDGTGSIGTSMLRRCPLPVERSLASWPDEPGVAAALERPRDDLVARTPARPTGRSSRQRARSSSTSASPSCRRQISSRPPATASSIPWFSWLFALPVRALVGRRWHQPHRHGVPHSNPWWAPPDRLTERQIRVLGLLAAASMSSAFINTLFTQTVNFAADDFGDRQLRASASPARSCGPGSCWRCRSPCSPTASDASASSRSSPGPRRSRPRSARSRRTSGCWSRRRRSVARSGSRSTSCRRRRRRGDAAQQPRLRRERARDGERARRRHRRHRAPARRHRRVVVATRLRASRSSGCSSPSTSRRRLPETTRFARPHTIAPPLDRRRFGTLALVALAANLFVAPASFFQNRYLDDVRGFSAAEISLFTLSTATPAGIGLIIGGRIADVRGRRHVLAVALPLATTLVVASFAVNGVPMWFSAFGGGFIGGIAYPAFAVYRAELFPTGNRGRAAGLLTAAALLGRDRWLVAGRSVARPRLAARPGDGVARARRSRRSSSPSCCRIRRPRTASSRSSTPRMRRRPNRRPPNAADDTFRLRQTAPYAI